MASSDFDALLSQSRAETSDDVKKRDRRHASAVEDISRAMRSANRRSMYRSVAQQSQAEAPEDFDDLDEPVVEGGGGVPDREAQGSATSIWHDQLMASLAKQLEGLSPEEQLEALQRMKATADSTARSRPVAQLPAAGEPGADDVIEEVPEEVPVETSAPSSEERSEIESASAEDPREKTVERSEESEAETKGNGGKPPLGKVVREKAVQKDLIQENSPRASEAGSGKAASKESQPSDERVFKPSLKRVVSKEPLPEAKATKELGKPEVASSPKVPVDEEDVTADGEPFIIGDVGLSDAIPGVEGEAAEGDEPKTSFASRPKHAAWPVPSAKPPKGAWPALAGLGFGLAGKARERAVSKRAPQVRHHASHFKREGLDAELERQAGWARQDVVEDTGAEVELDVESLIDTAVDVEVDEKSGDKDFGEAVDTSSVQEIKSALIGKKPSRGAGRPRSFDDDGTSYLRAFPSRLIGIMSSDLASRGFDVPSRVTDIVVLWSLVQLDHGSQQVLLPSMNKVVRTSFEKGGRLGRESDVRDINDRLDRFETKVNQLLESTDVAAMGSAITASMQLMMNREAAGQQLRPNDFRANTLSDLEPFWERLIDIAPTVKKRIVSRHGSSASAHARRKANGHA